MSFPTVYLGYEKPEFFKLQWLAEHVLGVAFDRPPVNAFNVAMWTEMHHIFRRIRMDTDVRAVVLYSDGKCFTAGLDLSDSVLSDAMEKGDAARVGIVLRELIERFQQSISSIEECERPVIGVPHGHCIGLAIDILAAADIRYAVKDASFSIREAAVGLAADIGTLQRFPKIVGNDSWVRELAYTARFFPATEAYQMGFVSKVLDTKEAAMKSAIATASSIAQVSPVAVNGTKQSLIYSRDHGVGEGLQFMQYLNAAALQTEDLGVSMQAAMTKSKPKFSKL